MKKDIEKLLKQISVINNKNAEILNATGGRFNIFQICGVNHYENTHSAIIAEFLNPKGTHGLESKFLEIFLVLLAVEDFNSSKAHVFTEYPTNGYVLDTEKGRIDILIESQDRKKAIIIENKIYANDRWNQLERYDNFAKQKYGNNNYHIFYLTLLGKEASADSSYNTCYKTISYNTEIIHWLEQCVGIAVHFPTVRETIIQYINHLKQLTNQDMCTKNEQEIVEILLNNLDSAKAIYQNYPAVFDKMAEKYFFPVMDEFIKEKGLSIENRGALKQYGGINFRVFVPGWKKCHISYSPEGAGYLFGIQYTHNDFKVNPLSDEVLEQLKSILITKCNNSDWWPIYTKLEKLKWEEDYIRSFADKCKTQISALIEATKNLNL